MIQCTYFVALHTTHYYFLSNKEDVSLSPGQNMQLEMEISGFITYHRVNKHYAINRYAELDYFKMQK